jgi:hypothetical protein
MSQGCVHYESWGVGSRGAECGCALRRIGPQRRAWWCERGAMIRTLRRQQRHHRLAAPQLLAQIRSHLREGEPDGVGGRRVEEVGWREGSQELGAGCPQLLTQVGSNLQKRAGGKV